ncbi:hypothetical protein JKY72_01160 [Candidatus Gracilibacteria bacterium]|nr:hypothetical protein [Candidatus Gracilibacteria bacterium]
MLPWLLRKPDLNDGSLILRFCRNPIDEIEQIIACAELCKAHQGWSRTCVQLISMFARYEQFVANVNRLLGVNVELTSHADVVAYLFANMKIADVRVIGCDLMQFIVIHAVFDTKLSVDWVFEWMVDVTPNPPRSYFISKLMCIFAQHLFLIRPVNERLVIYKRFRAAFPQRQHHDEIIYYLLHGENAAGTYGPVPPQCSLQIVLEMRVIECEDHVIAYIIDALHSHELVVISRSNALDLIFRLFERKLRFDLLMLLVNRHHPGEMCEWEACDFVDALKLADYEHGRITRTCSMLFFVGNGIVPQE